MAEYTVGGRSAATAATAQIAREGGATDRLDQGRRTPCEPRHC